MTVGREMQLKFQKHHNPMICFRFRDKHEQCPSYATNARIMHFGVSVVMLVITLACLKAAAREYELVFLHEMLANNNVYSCQVSWS